jgi:hypothetical protein
MVWFCLSACSTGKELPPHLSNPSLHPQYPPSSYITAVGVSTEGTREAELDAKTRVAEQITSKIKAATTMTMRETNHEGMVDVYSKVQTSTAFGHAEMIRIDSTSLLQANDVFYAFAYLSRRELSEALQSEYEGAARVFRRNAAAALQADDPLRFTTAYRQAHAAFIKLVPTAFRIQAARGKPFRPFADDEKMCLELETLRIRLLRGLRISIEIEEGMEGKTREVVAMALTGALANLGLNASQGPCGPEGYSLKAKVHTTCDRGRFGPACTMTLTGTLTNCDTNGVVAELDLSHPDFKGWHTRDEDKAMAALLDQVTASRLTSILEEALKPMLPIPS